MAVAQVPNELLLLVLEKASMIDSKTTSAFQQRQKNLISFHLVCRQWAVVARMLLYSNVYIRWTPFNARSFFRTLDQFPYLLKSIRTLDVELKNDAYCAASTAAVKTYSRAILMFSSLRESHSTISGAEDVETSQNTRREISWRTLILRQKEKKEINQPRPVKYTWSPQLRLPKWLFDRWVVREDQFNKMSAKEYITHFVENDENTWDPSIRAWRKRVADNIREGNSTLPDRWNVFLSSKESNYLGIEDIDWTFERPRRREWEGLQEYTNDMVMGGLDAMFRLLATTSQLDTLHIRGAPYGLMMQVENLELSSAHDFSPVFNKYAPHLEKSLSNLSNLGIHTNAVPIIQFFAYIRLPPIKNLFLSCESYFKYCPNFLPTQRVQNLITSNMCGQTAQYLSLLSISQMVRYDVATLFLLQNSGQLFQCRPLDEFPPLVRLELSFTTCPLVYFQDFNLRHTCLEEIVLIDKCKTLPEADLVGQRLDAMLPQTVRYCRYVTTSYKVQGQVQGEVISVAVAYFVKTRRLLFCEEEVGQSGIIAKTWVKKLNE